jgi:para-aminobenzoate synthetase/4-amino-4-deoxychorismate lyase
VVVPGGLGPHKWLDRTLLEAHEADDPATLPLLLDADGYVLEASRASIVVRAADARLYTPPDDGRILPGITARQSGATARAVTLEDLERAEAVYVASALRGPRAGLWDLGCHTCAGTRSNATPPRRPSCATGSRPSAAGHRY